MTPCERQQCALYMTQQRQTHNTHKAHCVGHSTLHEQQAQPFQSESECFHVQCQSLSVCACLVSGITTTHLFDFWNHYYTHVWFLESLLHTCVVSGNHYYALVLFLGIPTMLCTSAPVQFGNHSHRTTSCATIQVCCWATVIT